MNNYKLIFIIIKLKKFIIVITKIMINLVPAIAVIFV